MIGRLGVTTNHRINKLSNHRGWMSTNHLTDSDLDILVVVRFGVHRRNTARSIYRNLIGVGFAVDIVMVTEEDIKRYKDNIGMVAYP